jgi:hypothetical protein
MYLAFMIGKSLALYEPLVQAGGSALPFPPSTQSAKDRVANPFKTLPHPLYSANL